MNTSKINAKLDLLLGILAVVSGLIVGAFLFQTVREFVTMEWRQRSLWSTIRKIAPLARHPIQVMRHTFIY